MSQKSASVFVVDDDDAVRNSLRLLLKSVGLPTVAFASAGEYLVSWHPAQPGCLVLDVRMPGMSGLELQEELNRRGAIIPVIFISGHGDIPMAVEAIQHGAFDFLQKPFRDQDLIDRVQRALAADQANRQSLAQRDLLRQRYDSLTPREQEVMALVTKGKANKVMAGDLDISQRTVEIHRARVMEKMGAQSLAQLARKVVSDRRDAGAAELLRERGMAAGLRGGDAALRHLAHEVARMLTRQRASRRQIARLAREAVTGRAAAAEQGRTPCEIAAVARASRCRAAQRRDVLGDRGDLPRVGEMLRVRKMPHPQVRSARGPEITERADRRYRTVRHAAAVLAMAGTAIEVKARA
jgi:FixJ family two-component response regulator